MILATTARAAGIPSRVGYCIVKNHLATQVWSIVVGSVPCFVLCYAMLCYALLCYAVLFCDSRVFCCAVLCCDVMCFGMLCWVCAWSMHVRVCLCAFLCVCVLSVSVPVRVSVLFERACMLCDADTAEIVRDD